MFENLHVIAWRSINNNTTLFQNLLIHNSKLMYTWIKYKIMMNNLINISYIILIFILNKNFVYSKLGNLYIDKVIICLNLY